MNIKSIIVIACAGFGKTGISGGDRIFMELSRQWVKEGKNVTIITGEEGYKMCRENLPGKFNYNIIRSDYGFLPLSFAYFVRIIRVFLLALNFKIKHPYETLVYSASDFWPDALPTIIIKARCKDIKWIAGFYLFAPKPFSTLSPYKNLDFLKSLSYYCLQGPIYKMVKKWADMVFVTSQPDVEAFITPNRPRERIIVIMGGIHLNEAMSVPEPKEKRYDGIFMGRFHPQKGVLELIRIWYLLTRKKKDARLALIGGGPLLEKVKNEIKRYNLENNIDILGWKFGSEKFDLFKSSRVILHPAVYDSGGMSACEAMACGLPGVSFDLEALKTYYAKGMLKVRCFDFEDFANKVLMLLGDVDVYTKLSKDALDWAKEWDWDKRTAGVLNKIRTLL